jgi:protein-S-isoprenylcysteine O-methyltransferase Ste14
MTMSSGTVISLVSILWFASEVVLSRLLRAGGGDSERDAGSIKVIWIVIFTSVNAGVFLGLQHFGHFGEGQSMFPLVGIALIVAGIIIRWVAILTLKHQFTVNVAIREGHRLIRHGIYRYLRHPSYAGSLISFLGLGLAFTSYFSIIVIIVPICAVFLYRIRIEERVLLDNFGAEYRSYCVATRRLIPFLY